MEPEQVANELKGVAACWCPRLRLPRGGKGARHPLGTRAEGAVPGPVPGLAMRCDRVRARGARQPGCQQQRVQRLHRAPGHRPHARPGRCHRQGRHHAPRPVPGEAGGRLEGARRLRHRDRLRAAPPSVRGEQRLPRSAGGGGHAVEQRLAGRAAGGVHRAARSPVVRGDPGSPSWKSRPNRPHPLFRDFVGAAATSVGLPTAAAEPISGEATGGQPTTPDASTVRTTARAEHSH